MPDLPTSRREYYDRVTAYGAAGLQPGSREVWETGSQNKFEEALREQAKQDLNEFKDKIPVRIIQSGDTLGAVLLSMRKSGILALHGLKLDWNMPITFYSKDGTEKQISLSEKNFIIKPGQYLWIENGKVILADKNVVTEGPINPNPNPEPNPNPNPNPEPNPNPNPEPNPNPNPEKPPLTYPEIRTGILALKVGKFSVAKQARLQAGWLKRNQPMTAAEVQKTDAATGKTNNFETFFLIENGKDIDPRYYLAINTGDPKDLYLGAMAYDRGIIETEASNGKILKEAKLDLSDAAALQKSAEAILSEI